MRRFLALALIAAVSCTPPRIPAPQNGQDAVLILATVDGSALPHLEGPGSSIAHRELSDGMLQLRSDGTFYLDLTYFVNTGAGTHRSARAYDGMWTRIGNVIDFEFSDGTVQSARIDEGAVVLELHGTKLRWIQ